MAREPNVRLFKEYNKDLNNYHEGSLIIEAAENANLAVRIAWVTAIVPCLAKGFF
jgi:hypothetical protein